MSNLIPAVKWLKKYDLKDLKGDLSAGIIVAIMLVPQGMAYAMLAGLPPVIGLYSVTLPLMVYALFGSSRQLAVGPVALVSMMIGTTVVNFAETGSAEYINIVLLLSLLIGIINLLMGLFGLGFLVNFLSHAVISGFTSAAALIIGFSQLKHILGVNLAGGHSVFHLIIAAISKIGETNIPTLIIGLASIIILFSLKKIKSPIPAPLVVVIGGILVVRLLNLEAVGVKIVGDIPGGFPSFSIPEFNLRNINALLPVALTIAFIGFMESIAVAKSLAAKDKYKIDSSQELRALGLANIVGSFFSAYPVTGGFGRSAVNYQSGAKTPLASIITAILMIVILLYFTPLFYFLPRAVLGSIVMVAVFGLIDIKEAKHLFEVKKSDGWILVVTFISTLLLGVESGILFGFIYSLSVFIKRSAYPHIAELGYLEEEGVFRNVERYLEAKTYSQVAIIRIDASLYFANMNFLEDKLCEIVGDRANLKSIILDFSGINDIDAVSIGALEELMTECKENRIEFYFAGIKGPVRDVLKGAGWYESYRDKIKYLSIEDILADMKLLND
ncbi:SulP family inorganic anion transporter [Orenia marismortui]|uniref:SulP family inorganic anion transporter n=1 Tax=Orenia marismortui TaxID=46469 RepID=UPI00036CD446|nr:sulfate permease [Orenia marismortui]